jgi:GTPase SAR1 family protein
MNTVQNAKRMTKDPRKRILMVGPNGSGKTAQMWTLPGRKFAYIFDPNSLPTLEGCDIDYAEFMPDVGDTDMTLKGFNKGSKSDKPKKRLEPVVYQRWIDDWNERDESGFFNQYDWLCFDTLTFLSKSIMDRQLYLNGRYGDIEEQADYRIVGSKLADVFTSISGMQVNVYATGHISTYEDDKTKKVTTQIWLPGRARTILPMTFTDVWLAKTEEEDGQLRHLIRTKPEPRGLQGIRCTLSNLEMEEDVTIEDFSRADQYGIGALLNGDRKPEKKDAKDKVRA